MLVFFIVLVTNLIDKRNYDKLRGSVTTIYEDRIVAKELLFDLSALMHLKEVALIRADTAFFVKRNVTANEEIQGLIERYQQTKLTRKEGVLFSRLKNDLNDLRQLEVQFVTSDLQDAGPLLERLNQIDQHLHELAEVQITEARRQMDISNKAMDTIGFFTQIEIVFLISMAVLVQIIILYKPKGG